MSARLSELVSRGARAARAHARLLFSLFLVQVAFGLTFTFTVGTTLAGVFADRPLFTQGVHGDDAALFLALADQMPTLDGLVWAGVGLLVAYALLSQYLLAGLLGALAGRGFGATAGARFPAFLRLWIWALLPYAAGVVVLSLGLSAYGPGFEDLIDAPRAALRLAGSAGPGLLILLVTACAVDHGRAMLVVRGGGGAVALARGFARVVTRGAPLACYALYLSFWIAVSALYVAATVGTPFHGLAGALLLFAIRQLTAGARFAARVLTSAAQAQLEIDVVELGEVVKGPVARADVGVAQAAEPVE